MKKAGYEIVKPNDNLWIVKLVGFVWWDDIILEKALSEISKTRKISSVKFLRQWGNSHYAVFLA